MRAGYNTTPFKPDYTSAAVRDMPSYQHIRHKPAGMVAGYIREAV